MLILKPEMQLSNDDWEHNDAGIEAIKFMLCASSDMEMYGFQFL